MSKYKDLQFNVVITGVLLGVLLFSFLLSFLRGGLYGVVLPETFGLQSNTLSFANENVDFSPERNPLGREKFIKEYVLLAENTAQLQLYMMRAQNVFPMIEKKLEEVGLPNDLKYVAVAESALKSTVISSAGAGGYWQFMPETGRRYGLLINDEIDERAHLEKSTDAALAYFSKLYTQFGSWPLAAAAYNRGENGLERDISAQSNLLGYWDLYINPETSAYMYRILAIKYLMQQASGEIPQVDVPTYTRNITGPIDDLRVWSTENSVSYRALRDVNPWIRTHRLPAGTWSILLPN